MDHPPILWSPPKDARRTSRLGRYLDWLAETRGLAFDDYDAVWRWSVTDLDAFWRSIWDFAGIEADGEPEAALAEARMPGARWFPGVRLSWAQHVLRLRGRADDEVVLIGRSQSRERVTLTAAELRDQVARCRAGLARLGVGPGDRVAAILPNVPEAIVAALATASLGAVWTSCAPEFGTRSVVDRFSQVEPKVLIGVDGYRYGDREVGRIDELAAIRAALPGLSATVLLPYLAADARVPDAITWADLLAEPGELVFERVPFDHPLFILYSSGTTGLPKAMVHGHGGILLEHVKIHALHHDLGADDRFFWFTTTGWMMWNYLVSGLLVDATLVTFDGSPAHPDLLALWRMAAEEGITYFGTSAPYLMGCRKAGIRPGEACDLSGLRGIGSTGAPLPPEGFRYVYEAVSPSVHLQSVSGGTDVCSAFVGAAPLVPVWEGEISCRHLGCAVEAYSPEGRPVIGEQGELVITRPMPSMPVRFWNDPDGSRYRAAYFDVFPGIWRHGDWITITERGSCVISGRSDATLNRGGVRIGTAEFYAVVESLPEVADSLVVHLEDGDQLLLFVTLAEGAALDDALRDRIRTELRTALSPRHVPDRIEAVPAVPRTLSGKKLEVPVKRILSGTPPDAAAARGSLANPSSLDAFAELAHRR
ncbi:MAG TPA: acetoacetate--CoA ligase [candidate division Zixibacteria bacterium]|nr:acetoacetate--CoA ligase [candidate division Zixibacteria bacterium]